MKEKIVTVVDPNNIPKDHEVVYMFPTGKVLAVKSQVLEEESNNDDESLIEYEGNSRKQILFFQK